MDSPAFGVSLGLFEATVFGHLVCLRTLDGYVARGLAGARPPSAFDGGSAGMACKNKVVCMLS